MVSSIGQSLPAVLLRQAHGPQTAPAQPPSPPARTDWVNISNLGTADFTQTAGSGSEGALNQAAAGESALGEVAGILGDVKQLVNQSADYSADDAASRQIKVDANLASIDRVAGTASFSGSLLLDGTAIIATAGRQVALPSVNTASLGSTTDASKTSTLADLRTGGKLSTTSDDAGAASQVVNAAITQISDARNQLAAFAGTLRPAQSAAHSHADMHEMLKSIRAMMLDGQSAATGEGNRAAIVQMLK
jgi:flagellin